MKLLNLPGIYIFTNYINGKQYVGQSKNVYGRWHSHKTSASKTSKTSSPFTRALRKYGLDNFKFEVILYCPVEMLNELEIAIIATTNSTVPGGYNLSIGGNSSSGCKHSKEANLRKSTLMKQTTGTNEYRVAQSKRMKLLWQDGSYRNKVIEARMGTRSVPVSSYTSDGIKVTTYASMLEAQNNTGTSRASICNSISGRSKTAGGLVWRYE